MSANTSNRKWLLIEDDKEKAKYLLGYILHKHPADQIKWLFPADSLIPPTFLSKQDPDSGQARYRTELRLPDNSSEMIRGEISFFHCPDQERFFRKLDEEAPFEGIILLDVSLQALGRLNYLHPDLAGRLHHFLVADQGQARVLITIISSQAAHGATRQAIKEDDPRIIFDKKGHWTFRSATMGRDCSEAVDLSQEQWEILFEKNVFSLPEFLENMATLDQHACHNWENHIPSRLNKYRESGRWDDTWNMPIQLGYLIRLLQYDPEEFVRIFKLRDDEGRYANGSPICECLKAMGTKARENDPNSQGSLSLSFLGALFICWAAYRDMFRNEEKRADKKFIEAIQSVKDNNEIARFSRITPPQTNESLKKTIQSLYEMMKTVYRSDRPEDAGRDLLRAVKLDENGLRIRLDIRPGGLFPRLRDEFERRIFNIQKPGGGQTCSKMLDYFVRAHYCDDPHMDKKPLLGSASGFSVYAAGEEESNGIELKLGHA